MAETASRMEYLFCLGKRPTTNGCGCNLKCATQVISFLGLLMSIPVMIAILNMDWKDYGQIPIIFAIYKGSGCLAPLLMFIGTLKMDFGICYVGYIMHTIYVYGLIIFLIFIGLFWGLLILPAVIVSPNFAAFFIVYYMLSFCYLGILLYFNGIYFSFTKLLGQGEMRLCIHKNAEIIYSQGGFLNRQQFIDNP